MKVEVPEVAALTKKLLLAVRDLDFDIIREIARKACRADFLEICVREHHGPETHSHEKSWAGTSHEK